MDMKGDAALARTIIRLATHPRVVMRGIPSAVRVMDSRGNCNLP